MLEKLKFLTGEVKSFEDFVQPHYAPILGNINRLDKQSLYNFVHKEWETNEFYLQQFQPEMITEYFDLGDEELFQFDEQRWKLKLSSKTTCLLSIIELLHCETLSHFITNCIRADVKLKWKD